MTIENNVEAMKMKSLPHFLKDKASANNTHRNSKAMYIPEMFVQKMKSMKNKNQPIEVPRNMEIIAEMVGLTLSVHNGKGRVKFIVTDAHVGHKTGELALTRKAVKHPVKTKQKGGK